MKLDTTNKFLVTADRGRVVIAARPPHSLTPDAAVEFAAWLIVAADLCLVPIEERVDFGDGKLDPLEDAIDTVKAIRES